MDDTTHVLVGYATAAGSTAGIAERIASTLRDVGCHVVCRPIAPDLDPSAFDALVLGGAVHNMAWLPAATDFLRRLSTVDDRPVWCFSVGGSDSEGRWPGAWRPSRSAGSSGASPSNFHARDHRLFRGIIEMKEFRCGQGLLATHRRPPRRPPELAGHRELEPGRSAPRTRMPDPRNSSRHDVRAPAGRTQRCSLAGPPHRPCRRRPRRSDLRRDGRLRRLPRAEPRRPRCTRQGSPVRESTLSAGLALALVVVLPMVVTAVAGWRGSPRTGEAVGTDRSRSDRREPRPDQGGRIFLLAPLAELRPRVVRGPRAADRAAHRQPRAGRDDVSRPRSGPRPPRGGPRPLRL